ncbi:hypothetical protein NKJ73_33260 [Mesorhizobium sp. M0074]|uniref:hydantoinase/oxoprolinase family protein n=1 Tax=Mesorhizobium sp. M0074 TaxID=2956869 RepID=UPI0033376F69
MTLDIQEARRAIEPIAAKLKLSVEVAALGILNIVCANMVRAVRSVSVERGHDRLDRQHFGSVCDRRNQTGLSATSRVGCHDGELGSWTQLPEQRRHQKQA